MSTLKHAIQQQHRSLASRTGPRQSFNAAINKVLTEGAIPTGIQVIKV
ncbi:MAG: hypothetical protein V1737_00645 [Chloroflexota bacterium]